MIEATPPELYDGGYWYVVDVVPDPELGGQTPGVVPGVGWCASYLSGGKVLVRVPDAVALPSAGSAAGVDKFRGRIGGR